MITTPHAEVSNPIRVWRGKNRVRPPLSKRRRR
jgi:hypothetical protein